MVNFIIDVIIGITCSAIIVSIWCYFDNKKYTTIKTRMAKAPTQHLEYVFLYNCVSIIGIEYNSNHGDVIHYLENDKHGATISVIKDEKEEIYKDYFQLKWVNLEGNAPYFIELTDYNKLKY